MDCSIAVVHAAASVIVQTLPTPELDVLSSPSHSPRGYEPSTSIIPEVQSCPTTSSSPATLFDSAAQQYYPNYYEGLVAMQGVAKAKARMGMELGEYINYLCKYSYCSTSMLVTALMYLDRLINSGAVVVTWKNIHRLILLSLLTAGKYIEDFRISNLEYARLGGVSPAELLQLETLFLFAMQFDLFVDANQFARFRNQLKAVACSSMVPPNLLSSNKNTTNTNNNNPNGLLQRQRRTSTCRQQSCVVPIASSSCNGGNAYYDLCCGAAAAMKMPSTYGQMLSTKRMLVHAIHDGR